MASRRPTAQSAATYQYGTPRSGPVWAAASADGNGCPRREACSKRHVNMMISGLPRAKPCQSCRGRSTPARDRRRPPVRCARRVIAPASHARAGALGHVRSGGFAMGQMGRPGLSVQQKGELWTRWKSGQSLSDIGRHLGKPAGSIFGVLLSRGGIAPPTRVRSRRSLSVQEREEISRGLVAGLSMRKIAAQLGRAPSTISREVLRNGGPRRYRAANADERAWRSACRPKPCRLAVSSALQKVVAQKLNDNWSPQQIAGWLKVEYLDERQMRVSHETIYKSLYVQARGVLKRVLISRLRTRRLMRRGKASTTRGQPRGQIVDAVSIRERPAEVEDRAIPDIGRAISSPAGRTVIRPRWSNASLDLWCWSKSRARIPTAWLTPLSGR
jgi:DNA-binding CsgD family transcriptional regulator